MENKSKLNTILLVIIIILLVIGLGYFLIRDSREKENTILFPESQNDELVNNQEKKDNEVNWVKSAKFGMYYPSDFEVSEFSYLNPVQMANNVPESQGLPEFRITKGNSVISWGGAQSGCNDNEYIFTPGISVVACLKGMRAQVGVNDVREKVSIEDIKIFSDFVLNNSK
jgi:hypothetical protein